MAFTEPEGINFRPQQEVSLETLGLALGLIHAFLKARDPSPSLIRYDDWWEHDGLHFEKDKLTWEKLAASFAGDSEITDSMPGDVNVKVGIAPPKATWYLRYYTDLEDGAHESFFDLTLPPEWADAFRKEVEQALDIDWVTEKSVTYYKGIRLD